MQWFNFAVTEIRTKLRSFEVIKIKICTWLLIRFIEITILKSAIIAMRFKIAIVSKICFQPPGQTSVPPQNDTWNFIICKLRKWIEIRHFRSPLYERIQLKISSSKWMTGYNPYLNFAVSPLLTSTSQSTSQEMIWYNLM